MSQTAEQPVFKNNYPQHKYSRAELFKRLIGDCEQTGAVIDIDQLDKNRFEERDFYILFNAIFKNYHPSKIGWLMRIGTYVLSSNYDVKRLEYIICNNASSYDEANQHLSWLQDAIKEADKLFPKEKLPEKNIDMEVLGSKLPHADERSKKYLEYVIIDIRSTISRTDSNFITYNVGNKYADTIRDILTFKGYHVRFFPIIENNYEVKMEITW